MRGKKKLDALAIYDIDGGLMESALCSAEMDRWAINSLNPVKLMHGMKDLRVPERT